MVDPGCSSSGLGGIEVKAMGWCGCDPGGGCSGVSGCGSIGCETGCASDTGSLLLWASGGGGPGGCEAVGMRFGGWDEDPAGRGLGL